MQRIKWLIMDVDGTLTDGKIYIGNKGEVFKAFNIKDGYGIAHILRGASIEPIIITGRESDIVRQRCFELGIKRVFQGSMDKTGVLESVIGKENYEMCAYIGDDEPDLMCMRQIKTKGGLVGCPSDAIEAIKEVCHYISPNKAGNGAVRDFIEWIVHHNKDI